MRLTHDPQADAAYIYLKDIRPGEVVDTIPCLHSADHSINLDYNEKGQLVGIEILGARKAIPAEALDESG